MIPSRRLLSRLAAASLAAVLAACSGSPTTEVRGPASAFFTNTDVPGSNALFDVATRSAELQGLHAGTGGRAGDALCVRQKDLVDLAPLVAPSLAALRGPEAEDRLAARDFARALNASAAFLLVQNDPGLARSDIDLLLRHAGSNAWVPTQPSWQISSAVIEAMGPLLPAWQILRQTSVATDADRAAVDAWLGRLALVADDRPADNSLASVRGANDMMLGLMTGARARYDRGIAAGFNAQVRAMRPDGSFPLETDRGRTALSNQSRNIGLLVYSAEIAASQGQNLYATEVEGRSLRTAIEFLLRADADNALVDVYAVANRNPSKDYPEFQQDAQVSPWDSTGRAWVKVWTQRNPRDPLTPELRQRVGKGSRIQADALGGNITCFVGRS